MENEKLEKGNVLPWQEQCWYIGSKHSKLINSQLKSVNDQESLKYYCDGCPFIQKCGEIIGAE